jgi:hypothetical protein
MNFDLTLEDHTIIVNALHYYKKVEKKGNFKQYTSERINELRDKMATQLIWDNTDIDKFISKEF